MFGMGKLRKVFDYSEREGEIFVLFVKEGRVQMVVALYRRECKEDIDGKN